MTRKHLLILVALVLCTIVSSTVSAQANRPEWYRVQRVVTGSDPCSPDQFMGMLIVKFPWNPGPDGDPRVTGDNPFDCYGLDGGRFPVDTNLTTLGSLAACSTSHMQLFDWCTNQEVLDPDTGWKVRYFSVSESQVPGNQYFILYTSSSGFKGSLGTCWVDGIETERHSSSSATHDAGYDLCKDIGYDGHTVGKCAPDFTANCVQGAAHTPVQVSLHDFRNEIICPGPECKKVVMLTLSAEWCGPCRTQASHMEAVHQDYASRGFEAVEFLIEDTAGNPEPAPGLALPTRWATTYGLTGPVCNDNNPAFYTVWNLYQQQNALPTNVLIDDSGKVVWADAGYSYDSQPYSCTGCSLSPSSLNQSYDAVIRCQIECRL